MTQALEQELKQLPTWSYGLIAGVLALGGLWWYRKHEAATAATTTTNTSATTASDGTGMTADSLENLDDAALSSETASNGSTLASGSDSSATNQTWETQVVSYLGGTGVAPLAAQQAIENYLNGSTLDTAAQGIVNNAIGKFGLPPEGVSGPISTVTTPTSSSNPAQQTLDSAQLVSYKNELINYQAELAKAKAGPQTAKQKTYIQNLTSAIAVVQKQITSQSAAVNQDAS